VPLASPPVGRDRDALRGELEQHHAVVLRAFLAEDERAWVRRALDEAQFDEHVIEATGKTELLMRPNGLSAFLHFKVCDPAVFDLVQSVTGCAPVGDFRGRTYQMRPATRHVSPWHDDAVQGRLAALTINLSPEPFEGAHLQVRGAEDHEPLADIGDLAFGDAALIQISPDYQHRNSPLLGSVEKTSYAGFFYPWEPSPLVGGSA
jgi:hypothetical protein